MAALPLEIARTLRALAKIVLNIHAGGALWRPYICGTGHMTVYGGRRTLKNVICDNDEPFAFHETYSSVPTVPSLDLFPVSPTRR